MTVQRDDIERLLKMGIREAARENEGPPTAAFPSILDRALGMRRAGSESAAWEPASAVEAYTTASAWFRTVLDRLAPSAAAAVTVDGASVLELVRHVLEVERYLCGRVGIEQAVVDDSSGHRAMIAADEGSDLDTVAADWLTVNACLSAHAESIDDAALASTVSVHGVELSTAEMLIVRAFELWTHGDDICRATTQRPPAFDVAALHTMADLACTMLARLARATSDSSQSFRVTLTGHGGGSWIHRLDGADVDVAETAHATVVTDVVHFCRLVANRVDPSELSVDRLGDDSLADRLLAIAPLLADYGEHLDAPRG